MFQPHSGEHTGRALLKGLAFASPFVIGFLLLYAWPILASGYYSLTDFSLFKAPRFVGLANYERMLSDAKFWHSLYNTLFFTFVGVPVDIAISLAGAHILNQKLKGQPLWRALVYLPSIVPAVAAGFLWRWLLNAQYGFVNEILRWFHIPQPNWLLDSAWGGVSVIVLMLWTVGGTMLIYLAALKNVPPDLYEAAEIDGAGQWRIVAAIKLPAIRGALVIATVFSIIGSFQLFNEPSILKSLAPNAITTYFTPNYYTYSLSFAGQQHNYAATVAIVMGLVTMIVAYAVQLRGMRKEL